ncbi:MAG: ABC transporter permease [Pseudomonadota bacterium]
MQWDLVQSTLPKLLAGVPLTLQLTFLSLTLGFVGAVGIAQMRLSRSRLASMIAYRFVYVFRGTPLLVQIFLIYYGLAQFEAVRDSVAWVVLREPYWCAIIALSLNSAAYGSEIVRGSILSVPAGQIEAAQSQGMSGLLLFRRIIMPIALRQALPAYSNEMILVVKATSLASVVTLMEVTGIARAEVSRTFAPYEIWTAAAILYLTINFLITRAVHALEWRLSPHMRAGRH